MADYEIGYGKPPRSRRFQPGVSGNPKGRPKKKSSPLAETINKVLNAPIQYRVTRANKSRKRPGAQPQNARRSRRER